MEGAGGRGDHPGISGVGSTDAGDGLTTAAKRDTRGGRGSRNIYYGSSAALRIL
jgi:hypothetical protein